VDKWLFGTGVIRKLIKKDAVYPGKILISLSI